MDPFLHLLHETKLQVKYYHEDPLKTYGSPEDNQNAMKSLSAVELSESQSQESMVFLVMNSISDLPDVIFHPFFVKHLLYCLNLIL